MMPWGCHHMLHLHCFAECHRDDFQDNCRYCTPVMNGRMNADNVVYVLPLNDDPVDASHGQDGIAVAVGGDPEPPSVPPPPLPAAARNSPPSQAPNVDVSSAAVSRFIMNLIFDAEPKNGMVLRAVKNFVR